MWILLSLLLVVILYKIEKNIMPNVKDLIIKVDELKETLSNEKNEVYQILLKLNKTIVDLKAIIEEGGTKEEREELAAKLEELKESLENTVNPNEDYDWSYNGGVPPM